MSTSAGKRKFKLGTTLFSFTNEYWHRQYSLEQLIARVAEPVELSDGSQAHVGLSLGWSTYPDDAQDIDTLMGQADTALYRAKRGGRGRAVAFVGSGPA